MYTCKFDKFINPSCQRHHEVSSPQFGRCSPSLAFLQVFAAFFASLDSPRRSMDPSLLSFPALFPLIAPVFVSPSSSSSSSSSSSWQYVPPLLSHSHTSEQLPIQIQASLECDGWILDSMECEERKYGTSPIVSHYGRWSSVQGIEVDGDGIKMCRVWKDGSKLKLEFSEWLH